MSSQSPRNPPETPVREFQEAFNLDAPTSPTRPSPGLARLRLRLIREEFREVADELEWLALNPEAPFEEVISRFRLLLKELSDLRYVVEGTAVAFGLDIEGAYLEVHRSNMSKLGEDGRPVYREDGKVLKPETYSPADMTPYVPDLIGEEV